jgi:hypothetical protein
MGRSNPRSLRTLALVAGSFTALAVAILALMMWRVVTFQLGLLLLVALVGMYFGFGILVLIHRFVAKLE